MDKFRESVGIPVGGTKPQGQAAPAPAPAASKSPTSVQTDGLALLHSTMDREGITDASIRDRIIKLAQTESSMNPNAEGPVLQKGMHKGDQAHGLLQIMPKTAPEVGFSAEDIKDPAKAATAGVRYFIKNLNRFNGNLDAATVAHHSGPGGAERFLRTGSAGTVDQATGLKTNEYLAKVQGQAEMVATTPRVSGTQIAAASAAVDASRMQAMAPASIVPVSSGGATPKTPSPQAQQVTIPSTLDSDLFDALVARATEFA
jgi:SLT domain-containing protein